MKASSLTYYPFIVILASSLFISIYTPVEFLVTEVWMITPHIPLLISSLFLSTLTAILNLVSFTNITRQRLSWYLLTLLSVTSMFTYTTYRDLKKARATLPKIYKISRRWGVQGQEIRIEGVNFFPPDKQGRVVAEEEELLVDHWDTNLIIAKLQVPKNFGSKPLYIVRNDGVPSNKVMFQIRNPDDLKLIYD